MGPLSAIVSRHTDFWSSNTTSIHGSATPRMASAAFLNKLRITRESSTASAETNALTGTRTKISGGFFARRRKSRTVCSTTCFNSTRALFLPTPVFAYPRTRSMTAPALCVCPMISEAASPIISKVSLSEPSEEPRSAKVRMPSAKLAMAPRGCLSSWATMLESMPTRLARSSDCSRFCVWITSF